MVRPASCRNSAHACHLRILTQIVTRVPLIRPRRHCCFPSPCGGARLTHLLQAYVGIVRWASGRGSSGARRRGARSRGGAARTGLWVPTRCLPGRAAVSKGRRTARSCAAHDRIRATWSAARRAAASDSPPPPRRRTTAQRAQPHGRPSSHDLQRSQRCHSVSVIAERTSRRPQPPSPARGTHGPRIGHGR